MSDHVLVPANDCIPPMSEQAIANVQIVENILAKLPQSMVDTHHVIHGGLYARTMRVPAGVMITGAHIKVPTTIIIQGEAIVHTGDGDKVYLNGYNVLPAYAERKQAITALTEVIMTMIFATQARTVEEAEEEFTDQFELLLSRKEGSHNYIVITGA